MGSNVMQELANQILNSERLQGEIQPHLNRLAMSIVKSGKENGHDFTVEEVGEFLIEAMFPGSTPPSDRWGQLLFNMLNKIRVVDANAQVFKTMAVDSDRLGELPADVQAAIKAAKARRNV